MTLLATSWNIQQQSFAQVPPNNIAFRAAPARIPGSFASFISYAFLFGSYTNGGARRKLISLAGDAIQIAMTVALWSGGRPSPVQVSLKMPILIMATSFCQRPSYLAVSVAGCRSKDFMCGQGLAIIGDSFTFMRISFKCTRDGEFSPECKGIDTNSQTLR